MKDPNYWNDKYWPILRRRLSRRRVIQLSALGTLGAVTAVAVGCGNEEEKASPTPGPGSPTPAATPAGTATAATGTTINEIFGPGGPAAGQGKTFQLGAILPLSGAASFYGEVMSKGTDYAVKQIKEAGGPDIKVTYKDHKSGDITVGPTTARELATENKVSAISASYAAVSGSILPVVQQYKTLTFDAGGGVTYAFAGQDFFWGTRVLLPNDTYPGVFEYVSKKLPNAKRVAAVFQGTEEVVKPQVDGLRTVVTNRGLEFTGVEYVGYGVTDFSTTLARLESLNSDVIYMAVFGPDPGYFMKQYVTTGMTAQVIGAEFTADGATVAGSAYDRYWFSFDFFNPDKPANPWSKFFIDSFKQENGQAPDLYTANYYEVVFVIWDLIRKVLANSGDPNDGAQLQAALKASPTFKSLYGGNVSTVGTMTFDVGTHSVEKEMVLASVTGGKPTVLATLNRQGIASMPA